MSDTVDIGAARVRLIVDAADFEPVVEQGKRAIRGFGTEAQSAYDKTEKGTRRAADALLDYVNSLGRADTTMDRYLRNASRMGVEKPVLDAATLAWAKYQDEVQQTASALDDQNAASKRAAAGLKELQAQQAQDTAKASALTNAQAAVRIGAQQQQQAANAQQDFNSLTAPGLASSGNSAQRRSDAEAAFLPIIEAENQALTRQESIMEAIATARGQQQAANAQQDFNKLLGIPEQQQALALAQKRRDAEAAFLPIIEAEAAAEAKENAMRANGDAFIKQLENTQLAAGKTYYELLSLKAAELGVASAADPLIAKLKATNQAMGAGTISAKQYEFAVRGLPAQFTDVFVSLAAGQNPLTVLLQQGGQVKDMFGGIKTAVVAVGKETAKLATNPWILLGTAIAALAVSAYQATERMTDLAIATAKGNQVAGSAKSLSALAEGLNDLANINLGNADAAVSSLAEAGLLVGKNFKLAAEASARWATITGQSADSITQKFNAIARDPMAAVLDGTLRITAAQYAQLAALDRIGDKQGEVNLAVQLFYDQINSNSASVDENIGAIGKAWRGVKDDISDAWHELGTFFDRHELGIAKAVRIASFAAPQFLPFRLFADRVAENAGQTYDGSAGGGRGKVNPDLVTPEKDLTLDQIAANRENQKAIDELGTKTEKYSTQLRALNVQLGRSNDLFLKQQNIVRGDNGTFSGAGYDKLVNGLRLKVFGQSQGPEPTKAIKAWEKASLDSLALVQQQTDYLYADRELLAETYHNKSISLIEDEKNVQLASITLQIAALKGREHSEDSIAALVIQRQTIEEDYAKKKATLDRNEVVAVRARTASIRDYIDALTDANVQLARQGQQAASGVGTGSRDAALQNAKDNAVYQTELKNRALDKQLADKTIDAAAADRERNANAEALSNTLATLQGNYESLSAAENDYLNGSKKAWADWSDEIRNNAAFTNKLVTSSLDGIFDNLADQIATGKNNFKDFFASISKMIIEFGLKQAALAASNGSANGSGFGGAFDGILNLLKTGNTGAAVSGGGGFGDAISGLLKLFGGGGSSKPAASSSGTNLDVGSFTSLVSLFSAQGNAVGGGALNAYRNSVVSQPTFFPFARGGVPNVGLMGEKSGAGEAIMPLTRTSGGDLAVKAVGNQQQRNVSVTQNFITPGAVNRSTQDQIASRAFSAGQRALRRS